MKALQEHLAKIEKAERDIKKAKSWKRKNDLMKYHRRLKRELLEYVSYQNL